MLHIWIYLRNNIHIQILPSEARQTYVIGKWKPWSNIELQIFHHCVDDGMATTMINITISCSIQAIHASYMDTIRNNIHIQILPSEAHQTYVIGKWKPWSNIELQIFHHCVDDGMATSMINIIISCSILAMSV
jgi:hypothetical protein